MFDVPDSMVWNVKSSYTALRARVSEMDKYIFLTNMILLCQYFLLELALNVKLLKSFNCSKGKSLSYVLAIDQYFSHKLDFLTSIRGIDTYSYDCHLQKN
jgi:hypothetical protein